MTPFAADKQMEKRLKTDMQWTPREGLVKSCDHVKKEGERGAVEIDQKRQIRNLSDKDRKRE